MRNRGSILALASCLVAVAEFSQTAWAKDLVILKDGFTIQGTLKREGSYVFERESGTAMWMPKAKGFYFVDDIGRRVCFSHAQVQSVEENAVAADTELIKLESKIGRFNAPPIFPIFEILDWGQWDNRWERTFKVDTLGGKVSAKQRLGMLTPHHARVDALQFNWSSYYSLAEFGPEMVTSLLYKHPDLKNRSDANRRFKAFYFLAQTGWLEHAEEELKQIVKDFPDEKEKASSAQDQLQKLRALKLFEEIEQAHRAGRHRWAQEQLAKFPRVQLEDKLMGRLRALKTKYQNAAEMMENARRLLKELPARLAFTPHRKLFLEAAAVIQAELDLDDFLANPDREKFQRYDKSLRADAFVSLALQAERDKQQGKAVGNSPEQLLSLAVSGWLLGKDSAVTKVEIAQRLWQARAFLLQYQKTHQQLAREGLLEAYLNRKADVIGIDELAQIIRFLPPAEPEDKLTPEPITLKTDLPFGPRNGHSYLIQLPHEYRHGRAYPVLFVLHHAGQKALDLLNWFSPYAARSGYILVAPDWEIGVAQAYEYTAEEQDTVLHVLRDMCRRFQVDTDRVFLCGFGEGGNMAIDLGMAHPDQFAGVAAISGRPRFFAHRHWPNAQYLPMYVVDGDHAAELPKHNRMQFQEWMPRGYPGMYVEYKGRGIEWFEGEVPIILDWMDHKRDNHKRARGFPDLGKYSPNNILGEEFQTMRQSDNRFYWLSTDGIYDKHINEARNWNQSVTSASFQGRIGEGNQVNINVKGLKQLSVWFARDMIDFDKPVSIRINGSPRLNNRKVVPSLTTMLEDFYARGDRQRLFLARLDFEKP